MNSIQTRCNTCSYFRVLCSNLKQLPPYKELKISKSVIQKLPGCFEETLLGELKGALRQFRGPQGCHILEYEKDWVLHKDKIDPRLDPIGHLVSDAPHILVLGSFAVLVLFLLIFAVGGEKNEW